MSDFLFRLLRPRYWTQIYPTCRKYSDALEEQLDSKPEIERENEYTTRINGVRIWVKSYPYAYGSIYPESNRCVLPTARVREKLKMYMDAYDLLDRSDAAPRFKDPWAEAVGHD